MDTPLLLTKLCTPPVRSDLVPPPRLIERLNAGLETDNSLNRTLSLSLRRLDRVCSQLHEGERRE